ncbi:MAG: substrate-binding domain-containing protein [Kiritimatiellae bacterium]|nr:substrate-binding domain-containing protein [Kiritimatiellia bacterium]
MKNIYVMTNPSKVSGRGLLQGVLSYAATCFDWTINVLEPTESGFKQMFAALDNKWADGIVTSELENPEMRNRLERSNIPLVVVGTRKTCLPKRTSRLCTVSFDERKIGRVGAAHLLMTGRFKTYAFVPHSFPYLRTLSGLRAEGFRATLSKHHEKMKLFKWIADAATDTIRLGKWLGNLPKPAAIMAADDNHAQMVAAAARAQKIEIPGDIRLIGVDNNVLLCTTNRTQISSIATDFVEEGATAAAELKRLLGKSMSAQGRTRKICRTLCLVVKRASTSTLPPGLALVDRARDFIRLNASNPISPTDVAIRMGVSRRLLDLRFREFANSSLLKTITEARLEHVYKCVTTSREPIETVSRLAGFENVNYLKTLFRRRYGLTMREARKASPPLKR